MSLALAGLTWEEMVDMVGQYGQKPYRAKQIMEWIWSKRVETIEEMTNLPAEFRTQLQEQYGTTLLQKVKVEGSHDTTQKFLFKLHDGRYIETVLIPASKGLYGQQSDRLTICVSSQVGCAFDCRFCASGLAGFTRNLTAGEIAGQILEVERISGKKVNNVVFMGMGEPLANLTQVLNAVRIMTHPWGLHIGARHLTISTSGVVPQIKKLADHDQQIRLAISLHGPNDEIRNQIMPVNKKWNVENLFEALSYWRERKRQKITLEYILIKGVNDDLSCARELAKRARSIQAKINLIPYNHVEGLPWERPAHQHCYAFRDEVSNGGVMVTMRLEKGHDISAACGQLRLKEEGKEGGIGLKLGGRIREEHPSETPT